MLEIRDLRVQFGKTAIVKDLSCKVEEGQWLMIVGPNGAGKTTALGAITQAFPYGGDILLEGRNIRDYKSTERARLVGVLSQNHYVSYAFTVEEVVRLGRYAHSGGLLGGRRQEDEDAVEEALVATGLSLLRKQSVLTLSGGELQRTFLAQVLAQQPRLLLLDEPTNHLDLVYQKQVFELISEWLKQPGRAVVSVVHDLSLAKAFGTYAVLMHHGERVAWGTVDEVICPEKLNSVYDMEVSAWMRMLFSQWK